MKYRLAAILAAFFVLPAVAQPQPPVVADPLATVNVGASLLVTWQNATEMVDGTPVTGVVATEIEWFECLNGGLGEFAGGVWRPWPDTSVTIDTATMGVGVWCIALEHRTGSFVYSSKSNIAVVEVVNPDAPPPSGRTVVEPTVYTVVKQEDRFVLLPIGQAALGTPCVDDQSVNGLNVVPRGAVDWAGNVQPAVVVARCE